MTSAWAFAAAAWGRPGVETIGLDLQNTHGQCPALLLWRAWTLAEGGGVDAATTSRAVEVARRWDAQVLTPVRTARGGLSTCPDVVGAIASGKVREAILSAELEAERALLNALEAMSGDRAGPAQPRLAALTEIAALWNPPAPERLIARLVDALS